MFVNTEIKSPKHCIRCGGIVIENKEHVCIETEGWRK